MKKIIAVLLAVIMVIPMAVFADDASSSEMEKALLAVKSKITIPAELSEFSSYTSEYDNKKTYNFEWATEDYEKSMSISADSQGRIISTYDRSNEVSDKKLSSLSKSDIISFAHSYIKTVAPETFIGETDMPVYDEESYSARDRLLFSFSFDRRKDGVLVKDNYISITIGINDADTLFVRDMSVAYNYDMDFAETVQPISDYQTKYMEKFPVELVYAGEYDDKALKYEPKTKPTAVYRIKDDNIGYIDISTGEIITEDALEVELYRKENFAMTEDSAAVIGGSGGSLTMQEVKELDEIEGLLSVSEIESLLGKIPYVAFDSNFKLERNSLMKNDNGEYVYRLFYSLEDGEKYLSASVNGKSGALISLSGGLSDYEEKELTEREIAEAEKKTAEFLNYVAKEELSSCEEIESETHSRYVTKRYIRKENGIKYLDNGIRATFDAKNNVITNYSIDFYKGEFPSIENVIGDSAAYEKILSYSPVIPIYIACGGVYKKAATLKTNYVKIDALTGENKNSYNENKNYSYTDINGHWVEVAARKLAEIQLGFEGSFLEPEMQLMQKDFLRFMASGILGKYYANYTDEELYELLIYHGYIKEEEKAPDTLLKREDAFCYMIRMIGFGEVAELNDIYKVEYADGNLLSEGRIGYAAILSGFNIISGSGGYLRPQDNLTKAEAIIMLYKYLVR